MKTIDHTLRLGILLTLTIVSTSDVRAQQSQNQNQNQNQNQDQNQSQAQSPSQGQPSAPVDTPPTAPIPAYRSPLASLSGGVNDTNTQTPLNPDTHALAGAQHLTLGGPAYSHSYWLPSLDVSGSAFSNPVNGGGGGGWSTYTSISGELDVHRISGHSSLTVGYQAGASFSNDGGGNSIVQQLAVTDLFSFHRWTLSLVDQLGYLPQASFGYSGLGTTNSVNNNLANSSGLQNTFLPDQTILTASGQRLSESFVGEADVFLTRRTSLSFIGSDSVLHYFDNNLDNTNESSLQIGYNYLLSRKDTIAVLYVFDAFRYQNIPQSINNNSVQFSFARRITGKLSFQASGGPDFTSSQLPITGTSGTATTGTSKTTQFLWTANSTLIYQLQRTQLQATYSHSVTGGSGVLAGSVSDNTSGTLSRQLTRLTTVFLASGYSRNTGQALAPGATTATNAVNQTFNYWFGGPSVSHLIGRSLTVLLGYQLQYQNSNAPFCVITPCSSSFVSHQVSIDVNVHPRLIPF